MGLPAHPALSPVVVTGLALALLTGCKETPKPAPKPVEVCPRGQAEICFERGVAKLAEAPTKAAEAFERGCADEHAGCCLRLAQLLADGRGVARDSPRAASLFSQTCNAGVGEACTSLGELQLLLDEPDQKEVQRLFERACELAHADGCLKAGSRWAAGTGVEEASKKEALVRWEKACAGGNARGCASLGLNLVLGLEVKKDPERGQTLLRKACNAGDAHACKDLGGLHLAELVPDPNPKKGVVLLKNACNLGYGDGCNELAVAHAQELAGLERDAAAIAQLFAKACRLKSPAGCSNYGLALFAGDGLEADPVAGHKHLEMACTAKHEDACEMLEKMAKAQE